MTCLVVLDINGILADKKWNDDFSDVKWELYPNLEKLWDLQRSGKIEIILWTNGYKRVIDSFYELIKEDVEILDILDGNFGIIDNENPTYDSSGRNYARVKDLSVVWEMYPEYNSSNTLIFDDKPNNTRLQEGCSRCTKNIDEIVNEIEKLLNKLK